MNPRLALFPALLMSPLAIAGSPVAESSLIGSWQAASPSAPFAEMAFEKEGGRSLFSSWRHSRPDWVEGAWSLENGVIRLHHPRDRRLDTDLIILRASADRLVVRDRRCSKVSVYTRVKD